MNASRVVTKLASLARQFELDEPDLMPNGQDLIDQSGAILALAKEVKAVQAELDKAKQEIQRLKSQVR